MALTPQEEEGLLYGQLNDPTAAPAGPGPAAPAKPTFLDRLKSFPSTAAGLASPIPGAGVVGLATDEGTKEATTPRFAGFLDKLRGGPVAPPGDVGTLQPMGTPADVPVSAAPTLNPAYSQIGRPGGGGGAGGMNPLYAALLGAQRRQIGGLEEERGLVGNLGQAQVDKAEGMSHARQMHAQEEMALAEQQKQILAGAEERQNQFNAQTQKQLDEISTRKFDPSSMVRDANLGMKFTMGIGAVAGGMLAALHGGPNQYMADLHRTINEAVENERQTLENKKFAVNSRQTIASQMMQQTGNLRLSLDVYRQSLLHAADTQLQAQADSLGIPEIQAKTSIESQQLKKQINDIGLANSANAWKTFQQQAAAAAAAKAAAEERAFQHDLANRKVRVEEFNADTERGKALAANQKGQKDPLAEATQAFDTHTKYLENAPKDLIDVPGDITSKLGVQHYPGQTDARAYKIQLDKYNNEADTIIGHWAKDEEGKIPVEEFRRATDRFELREDMPRAEKLQRIEGLKQYVDQRARTKGVGRTGLDVPAGAAAGTPGTPGFISNKGSR